jgi:hypothetical protein
MPSRYAALVRQGGRLSAAQQWRMCMAAVKRRMRPKRPVVVPLESIDPRALDHVALPTDDLARAAFEAARRLQPDWMLQHALRCYAWASLFALSGGLTHDRSLLFAACALHDLGLTPHAAEPARDCFAVRGARAAQRLLAAAGAGGAQTRRVAHAIVLHLDLEVDAVQSAEAHLLHAGAGFDVVGRREREVPPALAEAVIARHPRLGMKQAIGRCMQCEAERATDTRVGVLVPRLGFIELIRRAPFDG